MHLYVVRFETLSRTIFMCIRINTTRLGELKHGRNTVHPTFVCCGERAYLVHCPISQSFLPRKVMLYGRLSRGVRARSNKGGKGVSYGHVRYISGGFGSGWGTSQVALELPLYSIAPVPFLCIVVR